MANSNYLSTKSKSRRGKSVQPEEQMKPEYDFSIAERGKFYRAEVEFHFPIYLEPDVDKFVSVLAEERKMEVQELVNHLLRADKEIIQGA
jgi:hypothetical protein